MPTADTSDWKPIRTVKFPFRPWAFFDLETFWRFQRNAR